MKAQDVQRFLADARVSGVIDQVRTSALVMMVDADRPDPAMALQLGAALLYEKPLLLIIRPGQKIPQRVRDLAQEIVEMDEHGLDHPANQAKLAGAIARMVESLP